MVSFSELPAVKKDIIFGAARKNFGPSYFVTALVYHRIFETPQNSIYNIVLIIHMLLLQKRMK